MGMFSIKRKSGTIWESERPDDLGPSRIFVDVPFHGSVCLVDDIEEMIVSIAQIGLYLFNYKLESYPPSHHME